MGCMQLIEEESLLVCSHEAISNDGRARQSKRRKLVY